MIGGILASGGLIAASFTMTSSQVTAALIVYALGFTLIVLPTNACPAEYFPDRFDMANGIILSGGSLGVMVMPPLFENLSMMYGWRGAFLLLGGINLHLIVFGALYSSAKKQDEIKQNQTTRDDGEINPAIDDEYVNKESTIQTNDDDSRVEIADSQERFQFGKLITAIGKFFKDRPVAIIIYIQVFVMSFPLGMWTLFTIPNAQAKGLSDLNAAKISIGGGVGSLLGSVSFGFITSRSHTKIEVLYLIASVIGSAALFVNYPVISFWPLLILSFVFGCITGFKEPAQYTMVLNAVGNENYTVGLGILLLCNGIAYPPVGFIAGAIFDATQSYNIVYCIMGVFEMCAAILIISPVVWQRFFKRTRTDFID